MPYIKFPSTRAELEIETGKIPGEPIREQYCHRCKGYHYTLPRQYRFENFFEIVQYKRDAGTEWRSENQRLTAKVEQTKRLLAKLDKAPVKEYVVVCARLDAFVSALAEFKKTFNAAVKRETAMKIYRRQVASYCAERTEYVYVRADKRDEDRELARDMYETERLNEIDGLYQEAEAARALERDCAEDRADRDFDDDYFCNRSDF